MSDAAEKLVCELRSLGGPDAERMADGTRLTALAILARRAAAYIEHQAAELARKTAVSDAYWEIVESFRAENAELRVAWEKVRAEIEAKARLYDDEELCESEPDNRIYWMREALAILAQHAPQQEG